MTYQEAMIDVRARVAASHTSFLSGMNILPRARREAMFALYAFSRAVDDIADDSPNAEAAARGLQQWREWIADLFNGKPRDPITTALIPAVKNFGLFQKDFQAIIDGMEMDSSAICAPDMALLDLYCDRVASAVGRLSVRIFGDNSLKALDVAYHLGRAFQLTNILRDLGEDAARARLYLPHELLVKHSIISRLPMNVLRDPKLRDLCRDMAEMARTHFAEADTAMRECKPSAMRPAKIMRAYYGAIFDQLLREDWRNPAIRVTLPKWRKFLLVINGVVGRI